MAGNGAEVSRKRKAALGNEAEFLDTVLLQPENFAGLCHKQQIRPFEKLRGDITSTIS